MKIIQHKKTFDSLLDEHLYRHFMIEQSGYNSSILESHGYKDNISDIVQALYKVIKPDVYGMGHGDEKVFTYKDMSIFDGVDVFFTGFSLTIDITYGSEDIEPKSSGKYSEKSHIEFVDGSVRFVPIMFVRAVGPSDIDLIRIIGKSVSHELMHAYNDYEMFVTSGGKKRLGDAFLQGYSSIAQNSPNDIENCIDKIIYFTDRSERNAHIGQLKHELETYQGSYGDASGVTKAIKSTESYSKLTEAIESLNTILKIVSEDKTDNSRNNVIKVVNRLTKNNFKRYRPAIDFLKDRVMSARQKFEEQSTKIAYDVFREKWGKF